MTRGVIKHKRGVSTRTTLRCCTSGIKNINPVRDWLTRSIVDFGVVELVNTTGV
jgi:hypothetical protein